MSSRGPDTLWDQESEEAWVSSIFPTYPRLIPGRARLRVPVVAAEVGLWRCRLWIVVAVDLVSGWPCEDYSAGNCSDLVICAEEP